MCILLELGVFIPLLCLMVSSLSRRDVCYMMCRLNNTNPKRIYPKRMKTKKRSKEFLNRRSSHQTSSLHIKISMHLEEPSRGCTILP